MATMTRSQAEKLFPVGCLYLRGSIRRFEVPEVDGVQDVGVGSDGDSGIGGSSRFDISASGGFQCQCLPRGSPTAELTGMEVLERRADAVHLVPDYQRNAGQED